MEGSGNLAGRVRRGMGGSAFPGGRSSTLAFSAEKTA